MIASKLELLKAMDGDYLQIGVKGTVVVFLPFAELTWSDQAATDQNYMKYMAYNFFWLTLLYTLLDHFWKENFKIKSTQFAHNLAESSYFEFKNQEPSSHCQIWNLL